MNLYGTNAPRIANHRQNYHQPLRHHIPHPQPEETEWFPQPMVMTASDCEPKTHHQGLAGTGLPGRQATATFLT